MTAGVDLYLLDEEADRFRIVCEAAPARKRLFEARIPKDATHAELEDFHRQIVGIMSKRRASDQEITRKERP